MAVRTTFIDYQTKIVASWLNAIDASVVSGIGGFQTPSEVLSFIGGVEEAPADGSPYVRQGFGWLPLAYPPQSHDTLSNRDLAGQHPIGAITDLGLSLSLKAPTTEITRIDGELALKASASALASLDTATKDASRLNTGTMATARLGTGTADSTTFLRGDRTWVVPPSGGGLPGLAEGKVWVGNVSGVATATSVVASGTAVAASPILTLTQTWNNASVAFQGLRVAVTDTASLAASLLLDLVVGGATKFGITKGGGVQSYGVTGSNYERGVLGWETTANVLTVGAQAAGTGVLRDLNLVGKNVGPNTQSGALATTATSGFFMLGSCAGEPTGIPAGVPAGMVPVVVNSVTGQLYIYTP